MGLREEWDFVGSFSRRVWYFSCLTRGCGLTDVSFRERVSLHVLQIRRLIWSSRDVWEKNEQLLAGGAIGRVHRPLIVAKLHIQSPDVSA